MKAAAENLTPVTLELGGKSPAIIAPDYPIAKAAERILDAIVEHSLQSPGSTTRPATSPPRSEP